jgi:Disulfide bond isomerase protein N-terminus
MRLIQSLSRFRIAVALLTVTWGVACGGAAPTAAPAQAASASEPGATLRHTIESRFPGSHVLDVRPSPITGLYELFMGDQIVYSDASGKYVLVGSMLDTENKENLTNASLDCRSKRPSRSSRATAAVCLRCSPIRTVRIASSWRSRCCP